MKRIVLFTVLILFVASGLYLGYARKTDRLRSEYDNVHAKKLVLQQEALDVAELSRNYGGTADIVAFTEALYDCARKTGIDDHEVTTSQHREEQQARGGRGKKGNTLVVHRLEVSLSGKFQRVAEYIVQLQKLENYSRISHLTLVPGENVLKAKMRIDLYSLGEPHAR
ncbi:MAG: hypothetical protein CVU69_04865 [Deltaproteobacteria bacterium HGW-Deltaproteobacteria-4]|nr:MAG: hypothetical protein CVU69_04865 [Deltaproteobacteria bacterium HGW-Deltaproteobacteria-4]